MARNQFDTQCAYLPKSEMLMNIENRSRKPSHHSPNDAIRIVPLRKPEAQALAPVSPPKLIYYSTAPATGNFQQCRVSSAIAEHSVLSVRTSRDKCRARWEQLVPTILRLSRCHWQRDFLCGYALPGLPRMPGRSGSARCLDLNEFPRALRSDHRSDSRPGLVR